MRYVVPIILLLPILSIAQEEQVECTEFHEGVFVYQDTLEEFIVVRTETEQFEVNTEKKEVTVADVEWTTNCNYTLEFKSMPSGYKFLHGKTLKVFINDTFEGGYTYTSRLKGVVSKWTLITYDGEVPDYSNWSGAK